MGQDYHKKWQGQHSLCTVTVRLLTHQRPPQASSPNVDLSANVTLQRSLTTCSVFKERIRFCRLFDHFQHVLQDYLIAQGTGQYHPGLLHRKTLKYCFSQDGVKWIDLEPLSEEVARKAATVTGMLSGEPAKAYSIQEPGAAPVAEGEVSLQLCHIKSPVATWQSHGRFMASSFHKFA